METIGYRIKQRRKLLQLTQKELASAIGVSPPSVTQWELDQQIPKTDNASRLCKVLKTNWQWIRHGKGDADSEESEMATPPSDAVWLGDIEPWDNTSPLTQDEVELPFFTEVELAAGHGSCQVTELHGPKLRFSRSTLKRKGVDPACAACVLVRGNSMEPVIPEGATVGIDTSQTTIDDGKMYAIDHDGMLRIKMLYRLPGGGIRLRSFNDDEHPQEMLTGDQAQKVRIIGKVFWYSVLL
jgi:phage repressor protein C with HTH and peptisase S24 domain